MTSSQKRARMRNWAKMLVAGIEAHVLIIAHEYPVTELEHFMLMDIDAMIHKLISNWELNYEKVKEENPI